ncbi:unnamed protein product [Callosobruchus maculatus]|uniref:Uncharacterized protein n=1 Tax=Callosobruchus maculatus TaxID=64391 RepID=A0A653D565_CALMS|nr:unnamed protein product [Callosobruchus maculatus]
MMELTEDMFAPYRLEPNPTYYVTNVTKCNMCLC